MPRSATIAAIVFLLIFIGLNMLISDPKYQDLHEQLEHLLKTDQPEPATVTFVEILANEPENIAMHYRYIHHHYDLQRRRMTSAGTWNNRIDEMVIHQYKELASTNKQWMIDIGHYGLGLIASINNKYNEAFNHFHQVVDRDMHYLNNSMGYLLRQYDSLDKAKYHFHREIELGGNLNGAYSNLYSLLLSQGDIDEVFAMLDDPAARQYFNSTILKIYHLKNHQYGAYFMIHLDYVMHGLNTLGFLAALLILVVWLLYLYKLDLFEPEKIIHILIATFLGMAFSFLTGPLTDILNLGFNFTLNGALLNDFFYCFIGIGMIEELVKIIPLFIILKMTKAVNEPYDYILYASLSALGFAFVENLIYFDEYSLHIIHGRALSAAVMHMSLSSFIAYGMLLNKYKRRWNTYLNFAVFFLFASLLHGLYDLFLISHRLYDFVYVAMLIFIFMLFAWNTMINNALNHSDFWDKEKLARSKVLINYLIYGLTGILLFEYAALLISHGPTATNPGLIESLLQGTFLIGLVSIKLSPLHLQKGVWGKITLAGALKGYRDLEDSVLGNGGEITIHPFTKNQLAAHFLPGTGKIIGQIKLMQWDEGALVKLDHPADITSYHADQVMICLKEQNTQIVDRKVVVGFYAIPHTTDLSSKRLRRTDFTFCGWALVN